MQLYDASPLVAATDTEIAAVYPDWKQVSSTPLVVEFPNPFTGETQTFTKWDVQDGDDAISDATIELDALPNVPLAGLSLEHLASLACATGCLPYDESLALLERPERIGQNQECKFGLHRLPAPLLQSLATLSGGTLSCIAKSWSESAAMESDGADVDTCAGILRDIVATCKHAVDENRSVFYIGLV